MFKRFYLALVALLGLCGAVAVGNYTMTQGAGTSFGSVIIGGTVHYAQQLLCDLTTPAQCAAVSAAGAVKVDGSAVTQPVSGTVAATQSGTWTVQPGNTANTTPWLASLSQGGNTALVKAANTVGTTDMAQVVAVANTLASVTPGDGITTTIYGTAPASSVIGATLLWNGTTYDRWKSSGTGFGAVNPGTAANWGIGATAAAVPANATYYGFNSGGNLVGVASATPLPTRPGDGTRNVIIDPCEANLQTSLPISITTATTTQIVAASASNKTYICSLFLTSAAADNVGIVEGTGGTCGTGTAGVVGGTTAANGPNFAANGGMLLQSGGKVAAAQTAGTNVGLCLITSAATPLAGVLKYVQAP